MPVSKPKVTFLDDSYRFEYGSEGVEMVFERFSEHSSGLRCELSIEISGPIHTGTALTPKIHNLMTSNAQTINALKARFDGFDWAGLVDTANGISLKQFRQGAPLVDLSVGDLGVSSRWLVPPLVSADGATVWAADGGTGKSQLALCVAVSIATGMSPLGEIPRTIGSVIYVDWEADEDTHRERLRAIWRGLGQTDDFPAGAIHYQRATSSLVYMAGQLRRKVAATGAVLVIFDSLGQARGGGSNDDDATNATFKAARTLGAPTLFIDHVSKAQREGQVKKKTSIGSVYTRNNARLLWVIQAEQTPGESETTVAFTIDKYNFGRLPEPHGFKIHFDNRGDGYEEQLHAVTFRPVGKWGIEHIINPPKEEKKREYSYT